MNYYDTDRIAEVFERAGHTMTDDIFRADVLILNTCSVRQRAEDKVLGLFHEIEKVRVENPGLRVILTGCMAQRLKRDCEDIPDQKYSEKIKKQMPWVNDIVNIGDRDKFLEIASEVQGQKMTCDKKKTGIISYVPISTGCDNFCTYCVVPFTRGKEISKKYDKVEQEVAEQIKNGAKLIYLVGQNVNSWKGTIGGVASAFPDLLERLAKLPGKYILTFITSHPKNFSPRLAEVIRKNTNISRCVYLPVQSGSDRILELMNRGYTIESYMKLIKMIRKEIPDARITTDIIVGFPGETDEDFMKSEKLLATGQFSNAYISEYSPREPAASTRMKDDVSPRVKEMRKKHLEELMRKLILAQNKELIGVTVKALLVSPGMAKTMDLRDIRIAGENCDDPIGAFVDIKVTAASTGGLTGQIVV